MSKEENKAMNEEKAGKKSWLKRLLLGLFFFIVFLVFVLTAVLYIPPVQNFAVDTISKRVNKNINGHLEIGRVGLNVFKGLVVKDVYLLSSDKRDTLLSGEYLNASLKDNLASLLKRKLSLNTLELSGTHITDVRGGNDRFSALKNVFYKDETTKDTSTNTFAFDIKTIKLNNVGYSYVDSVFGQTMSIQVNNGNFDILDVDLGEKKFVLDRAKLSGTDFSIHKFPPSGFTFEEVVMIDDSVFTVPDTFFIEVNELLVDNGGVHITDGNRALMNIDDVFDPAAIHFEKINTRIDDFKLNSFAEIQGKIEDGSFITRDEVFEVTDFDCGLFTMSSRRMTFDSLYITTPQSTIKDNLIFKYRSLADFSAFVDRVIMEGNISKSTLGVKDLVYFVPALKDNPYFLANRQQVLRIDGLVTGRVNALNANDISIRIKNDLIFEGRMNSRNLTDSDNALVNLDLQKFEIGIGTLHALIPGLTIPDNFYKLGRISFNGRYDGYFEDFVAYGDLSSDLGKASLDMRLDIKNGVENARFSGSGELKDFDLNRWTGNSDFGIVEMQAQVKEGKGLTRNEVSAILSANVNNLEYKGYRYKDFSMDGTVENNLFDGIFEISEPNIDLIFEGTVDFTDSIPNFDFAADVNELKLKELNLTEGDFALQGQLNIKGKGTDQNNAQGLANGRNFIFFRDGNAFALDSFSLNAQGAYPENRNFNLKSSLVDMELNGNFRIEQLPDAFVKSLKNNYPTYTKGLKYITYENPDPGYDFNVNIHVKESEDIFEVLFGQSIFMRETRVLGRISDVTDRSALDINFPYLEINGNVLEGMKGDLFVQENEGEFNLNIQHGNFGSVTFEPLTISATIDRERLFFTATTEEVLDSFRNVKVEGAFTTSGDDFKINIQNSGFNAFGSKWEFNNINNLLLGKEKIVIDDLVLSDGERTITFDDVNEKGVSAVLENLEMGYFNKLISSRPLGLRGDITGYILVDNIFNFQGMDAELEIPAFGFRNHEFGKVTFQALSSGIKDPVAYELVALDKSKNLAVKGAFNIETRDNSGEIRINKYPLDLLEYILTDGISETEGLASGSLSFSGQWDFPKLKGEATIANGATKIDYLGVKYRIGENKIKFTEGYLDFTGSKLIDSRNQEAQVTGGLRHNSFRDWAADVRLQSPQIIALNTTKRDNPDYYGFAQGNIDVSFSGLLENINISVTATTGRNSLLHIPVEYTTEEVETSFIEIINNNDSTRNNNLVAPVSLSGLSLDMQVNVTEDAEVVIIFDETANDILRSRGRGPIQLNIDAEGNFEMFGDYEVVGGEYLFTLPSLLVNKSFLIRSGGNIQWTGDPLDALLNLEAEYKGLQVAPYPFIQEYVEGNDRLSNQAKLNTQVALEMELGGTLLNPDIDFDISFPSLTGELRPLVDGKLRTLENTPGAYNDQVFGLLLARTFLPTNNPLANSFLQADNLVGTTFNTISEFLSNQFTVLITSLFEEALSENSYLSGIDVDFSATNSSLTGDGSLNPDEYDITLSSSFDENKWNVQIGGRYVRVNSYIPDFTEYFAPNFIFEYYLTEDRRLKLNVFARRDFDSSTEGQVQKIQSGIGLSYRREFNSFFDFANSINNSAKKSANQ